MLMEVVSGIDANQQALQVFPAIQGFKSSLDCVPFMNDVKFMKDHILQVVLSASEFPKTMNMLLTSDQTKPAFYFIGNRTWSCSKSAFVSNFCCCSLTCRSCCASGGGRCFSQHLRWKTSMTCVHLKGSMSNQLRFLGTTRRPQTSSKSIAPRRDSIHPLGVGGAHRITNCGCTLALAWLLGFWLSIEKPITGATLFSCCHVSWVHVFRNFTHVGSQQLSETCRHIVYMKMCTKSYREEVWIYHTQVAKNLVECFETPVGQQPRAHRQAATAVSEASQRSGKVADTEGLLKGHKGQAKDNWEGPGTAPLQRQGRKGKGSGQGAKGKTKRQGKGGK